MVNIRPFVGIIEHLRVASRSDKVQRSVNTHVALLHALRLLFLPHIELVLIVHKVNDGRPRVPVVNVVSKTGSVDHCELDLEGFLFKFRLNDVNLGKLVQLLHVAPVVVFGRGQFRRKERVDQS